MQNRFNSAIIIIIKGKLKFHFQNHNVICEDEDSIFLPKGESYDIFAFEETDSIVINLCATPLNSDVMMLNKLNHKYAIELYNRLNTYSLKKEINHYIILSEVYSLLDRLICKKISLTLPMQYIDKAEKIIIESFWDSKFNCDILARKINISEVYLRKLFKIHKGMSPSRFILKIRMEHAQKLLLEGCSVSSTAYQVGYNDIYQFSRAFKKYYATPPSKIKY